MPQALYVPSGETRAIFSFLHRHVAPLLFHPSPPVRLEAALLMTRLLPRHQATHDEPMPSHADLSLLVAHLLASLLSVVVADPDEAIRCMRRTTSTSTTRCTTSTARHTTSTARHTTSTARHKIGRAHV